MKDRVSCRIRRSIVRKKNKALEGICCQEIRLTRDLQEQTMSLPEQIGRRCQAEIQGGVYPWGKRISLPITKVFVVSHQAQHH